MEDSYTSSEREEGRHLHYNMGVKLDLLLLWLRRHLLSHLYWQTCQCQELVWSLEASWHNRALPCHSLLSNIQHLMEKVSGPSWLPNYNGEPTIWEAARCSGPKPAKAFFIFFSSMDVKFLHLCPGAVKYTGTEVDSGRWRKNIRLQRIQSHDIPGVQEQNCRYVCFLSSHREPVFNIKRSAPQWRSLSLVEAILKTKC